MKYKGIILSLLLLAGAFGTTFLAPARVHADTASLQVKYSIATGSADLIVGAGKSIKTEYGPLNFSAKSGLDTYGTGMVLMPNGNVGIGTTEPSGKLHVSESYSGTSGSSFAERLAYSHSGTGGPTVQLYGLYSEIVSAGTTVGGIRGLVGYVAPGTATTATNLYGVAGTADGANMVSVTNAYGGIFSAFTPGTGTAYGIYADASGALTNWAGYFNDGNVYIGGNVGIGTTGPLATLDVAGSASMSGTLTVGNGGTIRPQYGPLTLAYKSALNSWTTGITLQDTTGNVGIGTTGPNYKLEVADGTVGFIDNTSSGSLVNIKDTLHGLAVGTDALLGTSGLDGTATVIRSGVSGSFAFVKHTGVTSLPLTSPTILFRVQADDGEAYFSGNVGIGTTSPVSQLELSQSNTSTVINLTLTNPDTTANNGSQISFRTQDTVGTFLNYASIRGIYVNHTDGVETGALSFYTRESPSAGTEKMRIDPNGNVGIGTTGPGYLLDVNGTANMTTLSIGGTAVTATATQLNALQGLNQGAANVLTIAAGEVTLVDNESYYAINTEASAATDNLDYINGGSTGDIIILRAANDARDVVLIDSTVLRLAGNMTLDSNSDTITLMRLTSTVWIEISRSNNF